MSPYIQIKVIQPTTMNIDAVRLELLNALRKEGAEAKKLLQSTVRTWTNPPSFSTDISLAGSAAQVIVVPDGNADAVQHWIWTDMGTQPHDIVARNAPMLVYAKGGQAKTRVRTLNSYPGRRGSDWRRRRRVRHPGTKARQFSETARKIRRPKFQGLMTDAIRKGAQRLYGR